MDNLHDSTRFSIPGAMGPVVLDKDKVAQVMSKLEEAYVYLKWEALHTWAEEGDFPVWLQRLIDDDERLIRDVLKAALCSTNTSA